jgi:opacity protein-like surface antigen
MIRISSAALACIVSFAVPNDLSTEALAQTADTATLQELKNEIATLRARIRMLERRESEPPRTATPGQKRMPLQRQQAAAIPPATESFAADYAAIPVKGPAASPPVASGFYVRGDIGGTYHPGRRIGWDAAGQSTSPPNTFAFWSSFSGTSDQDTSIYANIGLGYRFSRIFRSDVTVSFLPHSHSGGKGNETLSTGGVIAGFGVVAGTDTVFVNNALSPALHGRSTAAMVSGYLDFAGIWPDRFQTIQPYVSAGVGASVNHLQGQTLQMLVRTYPDPFAVAFNDHTRIDFAWSLGAGTGIAITRNVSLDIAYKYLDLGRARVHGSRNDIPVTCVVNCPNFLATNWTLETRLQQHVLSFGVRVGL